MLAAIALASLFLIQFKMGHTLEGYLLNGSLIRTSMTSEWDESGLAITIVVVYYIITFNTYCLPGTQVVAVLAGMLFGYYEAVLMGKGALTFEQRCKQFCFSLYQRWNWLLRQFLPVKLAWARGLFV